MTPETNAYPESNSPSHSNLNVPFVPINNAQNVNIPAPAIPANDMVKLEAYLPGSINRILQMSEKEQSFTHHIVQSQHNEQVKINDRNIAISKEQGKFNTTKLWMGFLLIVGLTGVGLYLFIHNFVWGGSIMLFSALVLAAVFILGYFPESIFSIFRRGNSSEE